MNRLQLAKQIDKAYPGLLDEAGRVIEVFQLEDGLNCLFVQASGITMLDSAALQTAATLDKSYQSLAVKTQGLQKRVVGTQTFFSTTSERAIYPKTDSTYPERGIDTTTVWTDHLNFSTNEALRAFVGKLGQNVVFGELLDENLGNKSVKSLEELYAVEPRVRTIKSKLIEYCDKIHQQPRIGFFVHRTPVYPGGNGWKGNVERELVERPAITGSEYDSTSWLPEIPGYTKVTLTVPMLWSSHETSILVMTTYVAGRADVEHVLGGLPYLDGSYRAFNYRAVLSNKYAADQTIASFTRFKEGRRLNGALAIAPAELHQMCVRDVAALNMYNEPSVMLFGPPDIRLYGHGSLTSSEIIEDDTDTRPWVMKVNTISVSEYLWLITKQWYVDYMETGFYIFTPRNSNIRKNVLEQWGKLEYDVMTLRGTKAKFTPTMTVLTLPEAKAYAKGRAKACKDNDWLKQIAVAGTQQTWGEISSKELLARGRTLWMNNVSIGVTAGKILDSVSTEKVVYRISNGVITRELEGSSMTINPMDDDHMASVTYDRYYNKNATVIGGVWDDIVLLDASEKKLMEDKLGDMSNDASAADGSALIGFSRWIDPTGSSDIAHLSDEQQYRLHIRNVVNFDSMSGPLAKVLASFGYDTLIKYALSK